MMPRERKIVVRLVVKLDSVTGKTDTDDDISPVGQIADQGVMWDETAGRRVTQPEKGKGLCDLGKLLLGECFFSQRV